MTAHETVMLNAARDLARFLDIPEEERNPETGAQFDEFFYAIGDEGRTLLVHWLDVIRPQKPVFRFRPAKPRRGWIV